MLFGVVYFDYTGIYVSCPDYWGFSTTESGAIRLVRQLRKKYKNHREDLWGIKTISLNTPL